MFSGVKGTAPIEVFHVNKRFHEDNNRNKVNLSVGAYQTDQGEPWILPVVGRAEKILPTRQGHTHEYLPMLGNVAFRKSAAQIVFGDAYEKVEKTLISVQSLGGTGALRNALDFLYRVGGASVAYVSSPTWGNHNLILEYVGYKTKRYRYWCPVKKGVNFDGMMADLKEADERSVVILHACAHNPTGIDLTQEQWKSLAALIREKKLYPLFDLAYQGFASGDLDRDAWAPRYFADVGVEFCLAQSFSKNFGLYNERVGCAHVVLSDPALLESSVSQMTSLVRANYSNPPNYGAKLVEIITTNGELTKAWHENLKTMAERVKGMRQALRAKLEALQTPGTWNHITDQIGMFSYTGLNEMQVKYLTDTHHIYLLKSGRINMCGLNSGNLDYVANAIKDAVTKH